MSKPKARIKQNAWGNWNGYIGTKKVIEFADTPTGSPEQNAKEWLSSQGGQPETHSEFKLRMLREGEEIGYKTGWYRKPTDYTNR